MVVHWSMRACGTAGEIKSANDPTYRWQNLGESILIINPILNWDDVPAKK